MSDDVSDQALTTPLIAPIPSAAPATPAPAKSFVHHARIISLLTLGSRILGVIRESLAALYLGAGLATDAFTLAFAPRSVWRLLLTRRRRIPRSRSASSARFPRAAEPT